MSFDALQDSAFFFVCLVPSIRNRIDDTLVRRPVLQPLRHTARAKVLSFFSTVAFSLRYLIHFVLLGRKIIFSAKKEKRDRQKN